MVREIKTHQLLLQPQLLGGRVVGHGRRLGGGAELIGSARGASSSRPGAREQIEQVALTAGPVLGPGAGPIQHQIQIGHQLGPIGRGLQAIEGAGVNQGLQGPAVELLAGDAIAEFGQAAEGPIGAARLQQLADGTFAEIAHR